MNQRAEELLMGAPSEVSPNQLRELHIRLNLPVRVVGEAGRHSAAIAEGRSEPDRPMRFARPMP
jgi:hypothetical protein